ncbi:MAG: GTP-binding protein [Desulfobacteraceae bacterium 4572_130]|nr:MAG: GTP-binding protein [Desulfobacteraceae bacterium 4572_130]
MSVLKKPYKAKLIISIFMNTKEIFNDILPFLKKYFGDIDIISSWFDFNYTNYYYMEMGSPLFRRVIVFKDLIEQNILAEIKETTNFLEKKWKKKEKRKINIDPGFLVLSRFVLATGKDYSHRIYLGKRIYADLTLIYKNGKYRTLDWTYPDYAHEKMINFLGKVRKKYFLDLKK